MHIVGPYRIFYFEYFFPSIFIQIPCPSNRIFYFEYFDPITLGYISKVHCQYILIVITVLFSELMKA